MTERKVDYCLVGQGLAGSTLAWKLMLRGFSVLVIDRNEAVTASRIAAGLLTPITGPKLAPTLFWNESRDEAEKFYRQIEAETGESLFVCRPAVHLFRSAAEQELFERRLQSPGFREWVRPIPSEEISASWTAPWGGFEMPGAAQLHVSRYLAATRQRLLQAACFQTGRLEAKTDLEISEKSIRLPRWNVCTKNIIFCQGWVPDPPQWFENVLFQPAKGEILTLSIPGMGEQRSIHSGCWLAQSAEGNYLLGSTFEWKQLDQVPTLSAREDLLKRMRHWSTADVQVLDQQAAIRPAMHDFKPVLGRHPQQPRLGIMNGLGTKGSLMAPWLADLMVNHFECGADLPVELDVRRWYR